MRHRPERAAGRARRGSTLAVFLLALVVFATGASRRELWRTDEQRYAEVAREMSAPSGSWLVPHLNGAIYVHKPPVFFWLVALLHRGLDLEIGAAAKGVSVASASLTLALIYALAARLYGAREALAAALVLGSAEMFLSLAMRGNLDALLTACTTASLYACWRSEEASSAVPARWRLAAGAFAGIGILVKGPVALAVPAVVVLAHRGLSTGWKGIRPRVWLPALAVSLIPPLAWLAAAAVEAGGGYVRDLVIGHAIGHPLGAVSKQRPFWYYLRSFPASFLPWSLALPACLALFAARQRRSEDAFVLAWLCAPFVLLSLLPSKRHLYLAPILPGAALLVGRWLAWLRSDTPAGEARRSELLLSRLAHAILGVACIALGLGLALGSALALAEDADLVAVRSDVFRVWSASGASAALLRLACASALVVLGASLLHCWRGRAAWRADLAIAATLTAFLSADFHPFESAARTATPFYRHVRSLVGDDALATYGGRDWAANLLLQRTTIPRLVTPGQAEAHAQRYGSAGHTAWLVAEGGFLDRRGRPAGFEEVFRYRPPLGRSLILLRSERAGRS